MPDLTGKKNRKALKMRAIFVIAVLFIDFVFLPWLIKLPIMLLKNQSIDDWFNYGILNSIKDIFFDEFLRIIFLILQGAVITFIITILWNTNKIKRPYKVNDGIGGPEAAGSGQHGTAKFMTKKEIEKSCGVWITSQELKTGGIIFGKEDLDG